MTTLLGSPRMWPIGFIIGSAYSPLRIEREIPNRNWRDAFEDLLALNAGRDMMNPQSRKAEDEKAAETRYNFTSDSIQTFNNIQHDYLAFQEEMIKFRRECVETGDSERVTILDKKILPDAKSGIEVMVAHAKTVKTSFEMHRNAKASDLKRPGRWITSLIANGAAPGWQSLTGNSVDGHVTTFARLDAPPELETGLVVSEVELEAIFSEGVYNLVSPLGLPLPWVSQLTNEGLNHSCAVGLRKRYLPSPSSILVQKVRAEPIKLRDGSIGVKTYIANFLADNTVEEKEFFEEPGRLFEEMEHARRSMEIVRNILVEHMHRPKETFQGQAGLNDFAAIDVV